MLRRMDSETRERMEREREREREDGVGFRWGSGITIIQYRIQAGRRAKFVPEWFVLLTVYLPVVLGVVCLDYIQSYLFYHKILITIVIYKEVERNHCYNC